MLNHEQILRVINRHINHIEKDDDSSFRFCIAYITALYEIGIISFNEYTEFTVNADHKLKGGDA